VGVVIACDVTAAMFTTKLPKPVTASIVADPDAKIRVRERHRSDDCLFQYQAVFIVGAYQDVNVWRRLACQPGQIGFDIRRTVTNPGQKKQRHGSRNHRQHFDGNENDAKGKVWRETDFRQRTEHPPRHVSPHQKDREAANEQAMYCIAPIKPSKRRNGDETGRDAGPSAGR
jgi:hypothetical protein